jgi:hypothetical protein
MTTFVNLQSTSTAYVRVNFRNILTVPEYACASKILTKECCTGTRIGPRAYMQRYEDAVNDY